jgi:hypothetical protein
MSASIIRTFSALALGFLLTWAGKAGLNLHPDTTLSDGLTIVVSGGYYLTVRVVEQAFPGVGKWLLGLGIVSAQPQYAKPLKPGRKYADGGTVRPSRM